MSKWTSSSDTETVTLVSEVPRVEFLGHATAADLLMHFKDGIRQLDPPGLHGCSQCELEVLHWSGMRTQNTGTPRTSEHRKLKSHGNSFKLSWKSHGIVLSDFCGNPEFEI